MNVDQLKVVRQGKVQRGKPAEQMPMQIDMLTLGIGRIVSKDHFPGGEPIVKVYDINIRKSYKNITSAQQLNQQLSHRQRKSIRLHRLSRRWRLLHPRCGQQHL